MSNPKKKLPTGPIRIQAPTFSVREETSSSSTQDSIKQDSSIQESTKLEETNQESTYQLPPSLSEFTQRASLSPQNLGQMEVDFKLDSRKQESSFKNDEFKKVAMRLSETAVERLRSFRATTGLPYEILVDVMICNLDKLPEELQRDFLSQVKQLRLHRLVKGQSKGLETAIQKLSIKE